MATGPSVGIEIVRQVAALEGIDPIDLRTPLHEVIDVDALEALTTRTVDNQTRTSPFVEFRYLGYSVAVDETGEVTVDRHPTEADADDATEDSRDE